MKLARTRNTRPPMPWPSLHAMSDDDLRAVYAFIKSLGERGSEMPQYVPPDQEPKTPYLNLMPQMPAKKIAAAPAKVVVAQAAKLAPAAKPGLAPAVAATQPIGSAR